MSDGSANPLVVALLGSERNRFGYVNDDFGHTILLSVAHQAAFILGYQGNSVSDSQSQDDEQRDSSRDMNSWSREYRGGIGSIVSDNGSRIVEWSLIGTYLDRGMRVTFSDGTSMTEREIRSHGGYRLAAGLRRVSDGPGAQLSLLLSWEDQNKRFDDLKGDRDRSWFVEAHTGFRFQNEFVDDLEAGLNGRWERTDFTTVHEVTQVQGGNVRRQTVGPFLSLEKRAVQNLRLRCGMSTSLEHRENLSFLQLIAGGLDVRKTETKSEVWTLNAPVFTLGAGWSWKDVRMDGWFSQSLNLDNPLVRWALVFPL